MRNPNIWKVDKLKNWKKLNKYKKKKKFFSLSYKVNKLKLSKFFNCSNNINIHFLIEMDDKNKK